MARSSATLSGDDVTKVFRRFDSNGDGRISAAELRGVVLALGTGGSSSSSSSSPEEEVRKMMAEMDADGDGFVDLEEFAAFFSRHGDEGDGGGGDGEDAQLMDAFRVYDLDGNGKISAKELHRVMRRIGEKCSLGDCARMIKSVDADGDGSVDFGEFKRLMAGGGGLPCAAPSSSSSSSSSSKNRRKR